MMKVIAKDNFDRETISDQLIKPNVSQIEGDQIVNNLNKSENQNWFYVVVEDDYKLYDASILY